jgi:hypothetical protein
LGARAALTPIANRSHDAFSAHHWVFQNMSDDGAPGPDREQTFEGAMEFMSDGARLDRGLARLLDGIEAESPQIAPQGTEAGGDFTPRSTLVTAWETRST